ncbi:MAG TPA: hypothetical protein GXX14_00260 [Clostridiaceae bacterium]|nr:hypothetical protein [Clostridiaceae bacterium]
MEEQAKVKQTEEHAKVKQLRKKSRLGGIFILIFLLLYVPSLLHWLFGRDITTDILRIGIVEDSINVDAYIIRDEEVFEAPFDGKFVPNAMEGEKVSAGAKIAMVLNESSIELIDKIEEYELKIIEAQNEKNKNINFFSEDVNRIEKQIEEKIKQIIKESNVNSLQKVGLLKNDIDELIKKKINIIGGMSSADIYIEDLKKSRDNLKRQLDYNTISSVAELPGIVSYFVDGYEEELTPESIETLTPGYLESINPKNVLTVSNNRNVEAGKPYAKVIYGIDYYIVFALKPDVAGSLEAGNNVNIRINDIDREVKGIISYKSDEIEGMQIFAVKVDRYLDETTALRKINIDLIRKSSEGFRVPLKSLKDINIDEMTAKIAIVKANCAYIRDVKISVISDDYAIITNLDDTGKNGVSLYDTYIVNPKNIEEGQIIVK